MKKLELVLFAKRNSKRLALAAIPRNTQYTQGLGLELHRDGGCSLTGVPPSGGTSIMWGKKLKTHMDKMEAQYVAELGPVRIYSGQDF